MNPFFKTLFGDWVNLGFVAAVVAVEYALVDTHHAAQAGVAIPLLILAGVSWLARR